MMILVLLFFIKEVVYMLSGITYKKNWYALSEVFTYDF